MALPKKRSTKTTKRNRAAHFALKKKNLVDCPKCKFAILSHCICGNCGTYNGKDILKLDIKSKKSKN